MCITDCRPTNADVPVPGHLSVTSNLSLLKAPRYISRLAYNPMHVRGSPTDDLVRLSALSL